MDYIVVDANADIDGAGGFAIVRTGVNYYPLTAPNTFVLNSSGDIVTLVLAYGGNATNDNAATAAVSGTSSSINSVRITKGLRGTTLFEQIN